MGERRADLAAILFFLTALSLHDRGHTVWAVLAMALALLSKEAIGAALPVLVLWDLLVGRKPARLLTPLLAFGGLALVWGSIHPGIHLLVTGRLNQEPRSYVGFQSQAMVLLEWKRYWRALFNAPATGLETPWPIDRVPYSVAAWILGVAALALTPKHAASDEPGGLTPRRAILLGALLAIPTLLLPSLVVRRWAAYFVCIPALGTSIALGVLFARTEAAVASFALAVYLALGLWSRGVHDPSGNLLTEQSFVEGERATRDVERRFRDFYPTLPRGTHVLVSVAASGMAGIHGTLHDGQAVRIWYADPTIRVLDPERRMAGAPHEILLRITEHRDLVQLDPDVPSFRSSGAPPAMAEVQTVIGTYARGVAATGEPDRAVRILLRLAQTAPYLLIRSYDQRLAAMVLFDRGDSTGAEQILKVGGAPSARHRDRRDRPGDRAAHALSLARRSGVPRVRHLAARPRCAPLLDGDVLRKRVLRAGEGNGAPAPGGEAGGQGERGCDRRSSGICRRSNKSTHEEGSVPLLARAAWLHPGHSRLAMAGGRGLLVVHSPFGHPFRSFPAIVSHRLGLEGAHHESIQPVSATDLRPGATNADVHGPHDG